MDSYVKIIGELVQGIQREGYAGLVRAVALDNDIDPNSPNADCISAADDAMDSAASPEDFWGAALGMATCLRNSPPELAPPDPGEPEDPEPPDPPEPPDDPGLPEPPAKPSLGDLVLAALIVNLRGGSGKS
ncbi:hypothetical protein SRABI83_00082 [Arthrobacter sp. Bi83]|uniref:hypothetical protein n=1 Tax=Arthrobacter sp. Bi83 TaxID=2822353 RepID=UPI001D40FA4F|nr:hypothetical protein [Arthrobacter sp. Bi83]CAH0126132.1 hypothetical protein SRABI83_00082 [Arthrobacter sp. Bi83]